MAKKIVKQIKVQIVGGRATPAPPVGTSLGPHGINLGKFVAEFNERTREIAGTVVPVIVTIFSDRSFEFVVKTPPASVLLKQAANVAKGASDRKGGFVGWIDRNSFECVVKTKLCDLNTEDLECARRIVAGTARSIGIELRP